MTYLNSFFARTVLWTRRSFSPSRNDAVNIVNAGIARNDQAQITNQQSLFIPAPLRLGPRVILVVTAFGFLSGCGGAGWESHVYLRRNQGVPSNSVVSVVGKMKGVSVVSPPSKGLPPDSVLNNLQVKRGDVIAVVMFPTRAGLKSQLSSIVVGTASQSADGRTFIKDLAGKLQRKFGDPSKSPQVVRSVKAAGS
jgi:hypothetical protein